MKVVLLAGGLGSRLAEHTEARPKPMVEIGNHPILWHIMSTYAHHGYNDFIVACGYRAEVIKAYFDTFHLRHADFSVNLATGQRTVFSSEAPDWTVSVIDTGRNTMTGGRVKRLARHLGGTFMMTYGDGVADIDVGALVAFHKAHGKLATVTAVRPPARFGGLDLDGDRVVRFSEKPQTGEGWINGGYFVLEPEVLDVIEGDQTSFEVDPLETLASRGQLVAYKHDSFWQPMDTLREKQLLERLWESGKAPWKTW